MDGRQSGNWLLVCPLLGHDLIIHEEPSASIDHHAEMRKYRTDDVSAQNRLSSPRRIARNTALALSVACSFATISFT